MGNAMLKLYQRYFMDGASGGADDGRQAYNFEDDQSLAMNTTTTTPADEVNGCSAPYALMADVQISPMT